MRLHSDFKLDRLIAFVSNEGEIFILKLVEGLLYDEKFRTGLRRSL